MCENVFLVKVEIHQLEIKLTISTTCDRSKHPCGHPFQAHATARNASIRTKKALPTSKKRKVTRCQYLREVLRVDLEERAGLDRLHACLEQILSTKHFQHDSGTLIITADAISTIAQINTANCFIFGNQPPRPMSRTRKL